ncbi:MAG: hypothetical protein AAGI88_22165 [Pseudomonadota bacterium]
MTQVSVRALTSGWPLFWSLSIVVCAAMIVECLKGSLSDPAHVSHMISYSVRWSVPFIYLALAASSLQILFNKPWSRWLLRNRKELGLVFAVAMGWQGLFIFLVSSVHIDYYYNDIYYLRDELEGSSGYLFLAAMVATSFRFGRQAVTASQWKLIHKSGMYFLWAYPFSVYWWNIFYYESPRLLDYFFYWAGFLAFAVRIAAWGKLRAGRSKNRIAPAIWQLMLGYACIGIGLTSASTGRSWETYASEFLLAPAWSAQLELWVPFWPFQSFLPLFILGLGAWCLTPLPKQQKDTQERTNPLQTRAAS